MAQEARERTVIRYCDEDGVEPYTTWFEGLRDKKTRLRIATRVSRMNSGNFGDFKSLKGGVFELRIPFGSGYRVYFAEDGNTVVLLLCGGDKSSQDKDIEKAKAYWKEYKTNG